MEEHREIKKEERALKISALLPRDKVFHS